MLGLVTLSILLHAFTTTALQNESYNLKFTIKDKDMGSREEMIGSFTAEDIQLRPGSDRKEIKMRRTKRRPSNPELSLNLWMQMDCSEHFYGPKCETFCSPNYSQYTCDNEGRRVCNLGWAGEYCNKEDSCLFESCADHAECHNRPDDVGRLCICDGGDNPQCYPNYNPCEKEPCLNGGNCSAVGEYNASFSCICSDEWYGHRCNQRKTPCMLESERLTRLEKATRVEDSTDAETGTNSTNSTRTDEVATDDGFTPLSISSTTTTSAVLTTVSNGQAITPVTDNPFDNLVNVCLNGGKCFDNDNQSTFYCACISGWTGDRCDVKVSNGWAVGLERDCSRKHGYYFKIDSMLLKYYMIISVPIFVALFLLIVVGVSGLCWYQKRKMKAAKVDALQGVIHYRNGCSRLYGDNIFNRVYGQPEKPENQPRVYRACTEGSDKSCHLGVYDDPIYLPAYDGGGGKQQGNDVALSNSSTYSTQAVPPPVPPRNDFPLDEQPTVLRESVVSELECHSKSVFAPPLQEEESTFSKEDDTFSVRSTKPLSEDFDR